jgi:hypothetical protein
MATSLKITEMSHFNENHVTWRNRSFKSSFKPLLKRSGPLPSRRCSCLNVSVLADISVLRGHLTSSEGLVRSRPKESSWCRKVSLPCTCTVHDIQFLLHKFMFLLHLKSSTYLPFQAGEIAFKSFARGSSYLEQLIRMRNPIIERTYS